MHDSEMRKLSQFNRIFGFPELPPEKLNLVSISDYALRKRLVVEELQEIVDAIDGADIIEIADGCADSIYVLAGSILQLARSTDEGLDTSAKILISEAIQRIKNAMDLPDTYNVDTAISYAEIVVRGVAATYNIPLREVFDEVHRSNMTKVQKDGTVKKDAGGKVIKPKTYSPADIEGVMYGRPATHGST